MKLFQFSTESVAVCLLASALCGCGGHTRRDEALAAHHATEKVREEWTRVSKPLEIEVAGRTEEELAEIGSIGVWLSGDSEAAATEFRYDGGRFKPAVSLLADSTAKPVVCYPFREGLRLSDTLLLAPPVGPQLTGIVQFIENQTDRIMARIELQEFTSLLRLRLQSDHIGDRLDYVRVTGLPAVTSATRFRSVVQVRITDHNLSALADCALNDGMPHDFYLLPLDAPGDVSVRISVNGKEYRVETTLPPLRAGSLTELRLALGHGKLSVGSSWVDSKHPFRKPRTERVREVERGMFLQRDGTLSETADSTSIAWVTETDGRHGVAVALEDCAQAGFFSREEFQTGRIYETVDGRHREGCFRWQGKGEERNENESKSRNGKDNESGSEDECGEKRETLIRFSPKVTYSRRAALCEREGVKSTEAILGNCRTESRKAFAGSAVMGTAYIPSLFELMSLAQTLAAHPDRVPAAFRMPEGYCMTSCESGADTFYSVDLQHCRVSAYNSKEYPNVKLRLFYLF